MTNAPLLPLSNLLWRSRGHAWDYSFLHLPDINVEGGWYEVVAGVSRAHPWQDGGAGSVFRIEPDGHVLALASCEDPAARDRHGRPIRHVFGWVAPPLDGREALLPEGWAESARATLGTCHARLQDWVPPTGPDGLMDGAALLREAAPCVRNAWSGEGLRPSGAVRRCQVIPWRHSSRLRRFAKPSSTRLGAAGLISLLAIMGATYQQCSHVERPAAPVADAGDQTPSGR